MTVRVITLAESTPALVPVSIRLPEEMDSTFRLGHLKTRSERKLFFHDKILGNKHKRNNTAGKSPLYNYRSHN